MLNRASTDFTADGRNLEGIALRWNEVNRVTDDGGMTFYNESFAATSTDKTLKERAAVPLPLGYFHPWTPGSEGSKSPYADTQLGTVKFSASAEGLIFRARMFSTDEADAVLAEVNDGNVTDVSVGFLPYKDEQLNRTVIRKEIGLVELSLAPNGMGLHKGAQVLAVRAQLVTASLTEVQRTIDYLNLLQ